MRINILKLTEQLLLLFLRDGQDEAPHCPRRVVGVRRQRDRCRSCQRTLQGRDEDSVVRGRSDVSRGGVQSVIGGAGLRDSGST